MVLAGAPIGQASRWCGCALKEGHSQSSLGLLRSADVADSDAQYWHSDHSGFPHDLLGSGVGIRPCLDLLRRGEDDLDDV